MLSLAVAACSTPGGSWYLRGDARDHVTYLTKALSADAAARESMWRTASRSGDASQGGQLRKALMQSVSGHSGYDPVAADAGLQALLDDAPPSDIESVARLRMATLRTELRAAAECRHEVGELRQRLSRVVDIERRLNPKGN